MSRLQASPRRIIAQVLPDEATKARAPHRFGWRAGLDLSPRSGRRFYLVLAGAIACGMAIDAVGLPAMRMLFLSAVVNGVLAPPLLVLVMLVGNNRHIMGEHRNGRWLNVLGWAAAILMAASSLAFVVASLA